MPSNTVQGFRVSPQQKHLWLLQHAQDSAPYRVQAAILIEGQLDRNLLQQAITQVAEDHEILRTVFHCSVGMTIPVQVIRADTLELRLPYHDLSASAPEDQQAHVEALLRAERERNLDYEQLPLWLAALVMLTPARHLLLISLSALCADAASLPHLTRAIAQAYTGQVPGTELDDEALQYADLAEWQNELLEATDTESGLAYWQSHDFVRYPALKFSFERQAVAPSFQPMQLADVLPPSISSRLAAVAECHSLPLEAILLTAWIVLLQRLTGQSQIVVGTAYDGRRYAELKDSLGLFVRYLPLTARVNGQRQFLDALRQIAATADEIAQWQEYFSWDHLSADGSATDPSARFFAAAFDFADQRATYGDGEIAFSIERQYACATAFALRLACIRRADTIVTQLHYNAQRFTEDQMRPWIERLHTLLEAALDNPHATINTLPILGPLEREQIVVGFNMTQASYPAQLCLHQLFEAQVERTPEAVAAVFEGEQLAYRELNTRANQLAHFLRAQGVGPDVIVGLYLERSLEMVIALLGVLKAGGAYVPLDPVYPQERLRFMREHSQAKLVLTQQHLSPALAAYSGQLVALDSEWPVVSRQPEYNCVTSVAPDNLAYVLYTSGSTGQPKGVAVVHRALCNHMLWMDAEFPLTQDDRLLQKTPFSFDASVWEFYAPLLAGAQLVLARPGGHQDSAYLVEAVRDHQITTLQLVPSILNLLLDEPDFASCTSLRRVFCGGEPLQIRLQERFFAASAAKLYNLYGPTETTIQVTCWASQPARGEATVPIGRPISNVQTYVLDEHLSPVPIGVPGELYIGGCSLARGYLSQPSLTAERFIPDPFADDSAAGARLYKTGDRVRYWPDGVLEFLGRLDYQIKIRGFRVELGEIEAALAQHADVRQAVVIVDSSIRDTQRLVAYVVAQAQATLSIDALQRFLQGRLPEYMVPTVFVVLDALPLLPNGKLDRNALPAPDQGRAQRAASYVAPQNPTQALLAKIWASVLGVERVGIDDNFFELGGDSILSLQVASRTRREGLNFTPRQLFEHQTIARLAAVLGSATVPEAQQELVTGSVPLTPIQHWFFEQAFAEPQHWNQALMLEAAQPLDPAWLREALRALLEHHDALRMRFRATPDGWAQTNAGLDTAVPFTAIDLSALPISEQPAVIEEQAAKFQAGLDLSDGPLVQAVLFTGGVDRPGRLLLIIHHLVVDRVSWQILLEDLATAYQQQRQGQAVQLPLKTTSFQHWSQQLADYVHSPTLNQELDYWLSQPRGAAPTLPIDTPGGYNSVASEQTLTVALTAAETSALLQEVPAVYHTQINDALLAALVQTFEPWTGSRTLLLDLEGHGREPIVDDIDVWRTVGWFTIVFPVVLSLGERTDPGADLKSIKEQLRQVPQNGFGYGLLRSLRAGQDGKDQLAALPAAEVLFNYLGQLDQPIEPEAPFRPVDSPIGPERSPRNQRSHALEINASVRDGQLTITWLYSTQLHHLPTIEALAADYVAALRRLIEHCQSPAAGGFTPSDFPAADLSQSELDRLLAKFGQDAQGEA